MYESPQLPPEEEFHPGLDAMLVVDLVGPDRQVVYLSGHPVVYLQPALGGVAPCADSRQEPYLSTHGWWPRCWHLHQAVVEAGLFTVAPAGIDDQLRLATCLVMDQNGVARSSPCQAVVVVGVALVHRSGVMDTHSHDHEVSLFL